MSSLNKPNKTPNELCNDSVNFSFSKIMERGGMITYYTCPAKSSNDANTADILTYYDNVLTEEKGNKLWRWVLDCKDFGEGHSNQLSVAHGVIKLLKNKHGSTLTEIKIINKTWQVTLILNILWPFLDKHLRSVIDVEQEKKKISK